MNSSNGKTLANLRNGCSTRPFTLKLKKTQIKIGIIGIGIATHEVAKLCYNMNAEVVIISDVKEIKQIEETFSQREPIPIVIQPQLAYLEVPDTFKKEKYASQTWKPKHKKF